MSEDQEKNKALVRRFLEAQSKGDLETLNELLAPDLERVSKPSHRQLAWQRRKPDWPIDRRSCLVGVRHARGG